MKTNTDDDITSLTINPSTASPSLPLVRPSASRPKAKLVDDITSALADLSYAAATLIPVRPSASEISYRTALYKAAERKRIREYIEVVSAPLKACPRSKFAAPAPLLVADITENSKLLANSNSIANVDVEPRRARCG
jgi:hypothetical protein